MEDISKGLDIAREMKQIMNLFKQVMERHFKSSHGDQKGHMTGPQGMLMGILKQGGKMKVSELSEKLGLSNSTVSGILDRLENQGMVERTRSEEDRRVVYIDITEKFKEHIQQHFDDVERELGTMMNRATAEELDTIQNGLETLRMVLERYKQPND